MSRRLHIDFETYSTADLRNVGMHAYAEHPDTGVWCMAWALDDGPVQLWKAWEEYGPTSLPSEFTQALADEDVLIVAHNVGFELEIWNQVMVRKYGWPRLDPARCRCTAAMARAMSLPGDLDNAAKALGLTERKDDTGRSLMLQMCRPRRIEGGKPVWWNVPEKLERLYEYCKQDVVVERALEKRMLPLSAIEQIVWQIDHKINGRGLYCDEPAIRAAIKLVEAAQTFADKEMSRITKGYVRACTNTIDLTKWIASRGVPCDSIAKDRVIDMLKDNIPDDVRAALELRQATGKSSTAKLYRMLQGRSKDGRIKGLLIYHGANTGRWAGVRVQAQNLPRPEKGFEFADIEAAIRDITAGASYEYIDLAYGPPLVVVANCLRSFFTAGPGADLIVGDFSAIEARVIAWLAGQHDVLDIFRGDGKIYEHAASGIYNVPASEIKKDDDRRQVGKVSILALGYGGGIGAFVSMAKNYNVDMAEALPTLWAAADYATKRKAVRAYRSWRKRSRDKRTSREAAVAADLTKIAWRKANPNIASYWYELEDAAIAAVQKPGVQFTVRGKVTYKVAGSFLWCRLPSGRALCYPYPELVERKVPWGGTKKGLRYKGIDSTSPSKKWGLLDTYGGKLAENITQAVARDLLANALYLAEKHNYPVVQHVHDEVVSEVPAGTGDEKEFEALLSRAPGWAAGLPTGSEVWRGKRYRK